MAAPGIDACSSWMMSEAFPTAVSDLSAASVPASRRLPPGLRRWIAQCQGDSSFRRPVAFPEFLAQFLTRPHAGELDFDVPTRLQSGQAYQIFRQVNNAHLFAMSSRKASPPRPMDAACSTR